jgi:hypothetical protein
MNMLGNSLDEIPDEIQKAACVLMKNIQHPKGRGYTIERITAALHSEAMARTAVFGTERARITHKTPNWWRDIAPEWEFGLHHLHGSLDSVFDHPKWVTLKESNTTFLHSEPYAERGLYKEKLQKLIDFCDEHKLVFSIRPDSTHFPGKTILITFRPMTSEEKNEELHLKTLDKTIIK